jgi:hypothetical protein
VNEWSQAYFEDVLRASVRFNIACEGVALAAFAAVLEGDEALARRVIRANTLLLGIWNVGVMALLDPDTTMPEVVPA